MESQQQIHRCQRKGRELEEGDKVLFNDRQRPLTVVGRHDRQNSSRTWRRRDEDKYHTVIELEGNGTEYHLLCNRGWDSGPMLYRERDWDENKTNRIGLSPKYSRMGERVESMEVVES